MEKARSDDVNAYTLRYDAFRAGLGPVLFKAIETGDASWVAQFVERFGQKQGENMDSMWKVATVLDDIKIHVKMKISALWVSLMLCYIYGDYFGLYKPGKLQGMLEGKMGPLGPTTQGVLLGTAILMAIPSVMVFLSLALKPRPNRWLNIILGVIFTLIMLITIPGALGLLPFLGSLFLGVVEVVLTLLIVWYALNWPKQEAV